MALNTDSRTKNVSRNILMSFLYKIVTLVLIFVSRKFFIQYIGIEYLGINTLFANVLTLLSLADLGLGTAMNVSLYKPIAQNNTQALVALLNYYKRLYRYIALAVAVMGCLLLPFLGYIVNLNQGIPYLEVYYIVFVAKSSISYLNAYKSSIITADQKGYLLSRVSISIDIIKVILQIALIVLTKNYLIYILMDVIGTIIYNCAVTYIANKQYPFLRNTEQISHEDKKSIATNVSSIFLYKISYALLNGTDNILISMLIGTVAVGLYANYNTITSNVSAFVGLLFSALTPSIGNLVATESAKRRYSVFQIMQMLSFWLCGIAVSCCYILTDDFIVLWLGQRFVLNHLVVIAIIVNLYLSICLTPIWSFREGTGMYIQIRYIMLVTATLNIILSILLGIYLGLAGILFASALARVLTYFWYEPKILYRQFFHESPWKYYLAQAINIGLIAVVITICVIATQPITLGGVFGWITKAIVCITICNIVYVLRYCRTPEFHVLTAKIMRIIRRH